MIHFYNTLTRTKEKFVAMNANKVSLYVCGVTVYDYCHMGHARTYTSADLLVRYLTFRGYEVNYVRNITDIDDKIIKRANESGKTCDDITNTFIHAMHEDFAKLNLIAPNQEPKATDYIPQMIALIEKIIANKHAYAADNGDVYFNVRSFKEYGCLSNHSIDDLESGARVEVGDIKHDPLDFALWKSAKPNEPYWESPWGRGRPGWHIECSAMSMSLLGEQFDLHAGGRDLIFPHHENEIAQSQAATHKPFANCWLHGGFLQIDQEKMSKSLGNFVTIRDVFAEYDYETVRYVFVASHYRSPLVYTVEALTQAKQSLARIYNALRFLPEKAALVDSSFETQFIEAMDDDLNTPMALSHLFGLAHEIQRLKENNEIDIAAAHGALLKKLGGVLGLFQDDPETFFQAGVDVDVAKIETLIAKRNAARAQKNWKEADKIRDELLAMGIMIEDTAGNTTWRKV